MTKNDEPLTLAEAIKRDVLERGAEGLNPGDRERILADHAAQEQARLAELGRMVDAAFEKAGGK